MSDDPTRVVHLTLTKEEFVAFTAAANLGVFLAMGSQNNSIVAGRLFMSASQAMERIGPNGWSDFLDQTKRLGTAAWPELVTTEGEYVGRGRGRRKRT